MMKLLSLITAFLLASNVDAVCFNNDACDPGTFCTGPQSKALSFCESCENLCFYQTTCSVFLEPDKSNCLERCAGYECPSTGSVSGDPHFQMLSGKKFDFHGVCDLILLQNPEFPQSLGMDIHVRTKEFKKHFSYVSSAVVRIGNNTLEVMGDLHENLYWINGEAGANLDRGVSGYPVSYRKVHSMQHEFVLHLDDDVSIVMKTFKKFVKVNIEGVTRKSFGASRGLLGSYNSVEMFARDNSILEDSNEFGMEWQVKPKDGMIFHSIEGPQVPDMCKLPSTSDVRRRLVESRINKEEAEIACSRVSQRDFDLCVFDVMVTSDIDVVGAY